MQTMMWFMATFHLELTSVATSTIVNKLLFH